MIYLLYLSTAFLTATSVILLRNRFNFTPLLAASQSKFTGQSPSVSICIPARNEEDTIKRSVKSALCQQYPNLEVLVMDDRSTDDTGAILEELVQNNPEQLRIFSSRRKPGDWLGKSWACHQLAEVASGEILIFIDADTWLEKDTVARVVRTMGHDVVDLVTVWPRQVLKSFWERMLIPLMYYALLSFLPAHYVSRAPRWMPPFLRKRFLSSFTAACGQFMAFKKEVYQKIGGHASVKNKIVEDVELARNIRKAGFKMKMYYGSRSVACRMYRSGKEIREGFRKNFLAGFGYNLFLFTMTGMLHLAVYVLPFITLFIGIAVRNPSLIWWSVVPVALIYIHRFLLALWFGWNPLYGVLHPFAVLWYQRLALTVLIDYFSGRKPRWKGRPVGK